MVLTRVCSSWRSLAIAFPRLWARIHIPFLHILTREALQSEEEDYITLTFGPSIPSYQMIDVLRLRCQGIREWLSRSGECPLAISISYEWDFADNRPVIAWSDETTTTFLAETIMPFASRCRELELDGPVHVYYILEATLSARTLTQLVELKLLAWCEIFFPEGSDPKPSLNLFRDPPNLRWVSMDNLPLIFDRVLQHKFLPWQNITSLSIVVGCTLLHTATLLKLCPHLNHGYFKIVDNYAFDFSNF